MKRMVGMNITSNAYRSHDNRKHTILVLGGFGFIGKNLTEELLASDNYKVVVFDSPSFPVNYISPHPNLSVCLGDFNSPADLLKTFTEHRFDSVVHLISSTIPSTSNGINMIYDIESNLIPTLRLLSIMNEKGVEKIVFASSGGTVYGPSSSLSGRAVPETAVTSPICSHGIIKLTIEKYLALYNHLYGLNYLVLRLANPFGEYHRSEIQGLINVVLRKVLKGADVQVCGDGDIVRDYIYVKDCVLAMRLLIEKNVVNETINVGTGVGTSINEVLSKISEITGPLNIVRSPCRSFDVPRVVLDISKMKRLIDIDFTSLDAGIRNTYNWLLGSEKRFF